jgi:hypothetical protein
MYNILLFMAWTNAKDARAPDRERDDDFIDEYLLLFWACTLGRTYVSFTPTGT